MNDVFPWQCVYDELGIEIPELDDKPLGSYVEDHAASIPDAIALRYFDRSIDFAELNAEADKMANVLESLGVASGQVVGFHMPNIPQYIVSLLACTKLGCTGSGVSPLLSANELAFQVENAKISVLVSLDSLLPNTLAKLTQPPACLRHVICAGATDYLQAQDHALPTIPDIATHDYRDLMSKATGSFSRPEIGGDDVMMIQYTGGTTGAPKGAQLTVRTLMNNGNLTSVYFPWEKARETTHTAFPLYHVAGLSLALASMRFGACMFLIPDPRDVEHICEQMLKFPPTRLAAVPSLYQMLVNTPAFADVDFSGLKTAFTGAAPMSLPERHKLESVIGEGRLTDTFGMTETGPVHLCNPPQRCKPASVGIPIPLAETRVVDLETGEQEMPVGEAGEIITTGPQVMKGYLNLPEESAHAMRQWRGKTWMYSGDVGYTDEEGYIYLCDRAKDMLIVGGYKVFSVEVEPKLQKLPEIALCAVIGEPNEERPGNDIVNLYVQLTPEAAGQDAAALEQNIIAFCREEMAPYKIPKKIHFMDSIPLTAVGKIDKKALRRA